MGIVTTGLGIVGGVFVGYKIGQRSKSKDRQKKKSSNQEEPDVSASQALVNNIDVFLPLLPELEKGKLNVERWDDAVKQVNNKNLSREWERRRSLEVRFWVDMLAIWGLKYANCAAFKGNTYYADKYELTDGEMSEGVDYVVESRYWELTTTDEQGRNVQKVVLKGKAHKK